MRTERDLPRRKHELLCILQKALVAQCIALPAAGALGEIRQSSHPMAKQSPRAQSQAVTLSCKSRIGSPWITAQSNFVPVIVSTLTGYFYLIQHD